MNEQTTKFPYVWNIMVVNNRLYIKVDGLSWWLAYCWNSTVIIGWYSVPCKWAIKNIGTSESKMSLIRCHLRQSTYLKLRGSDKNDPLFCWPRCLPFLDLHKLTGLPTACSQQPKCKPEIFKALSTPFVDCIQEHQFVGAQCIWRTSRLSRFHVEFDWI